MRMLGLSRNKQEQERATAAGAEGFRSHIANGAWRGRERGGPGRASWRDPDGG